MLAKQVHWRLNSPGKLDLAHLSLGRIQDLAKKSTEVSNMRQAQPLISCRQKAKKKEQKIGNVHESELGA